MQGGLNLDPDLVSHTDYPHDAGRLKVEAGQRQWKFDENPDLLRADFHLAGLCLDPLRDPTDLKTKLKVFIGNFTRLELAKDRFGIEVDKLALDLREVLMIKHGPHLLVPGSILSVHFTNPNGHDR